MLICFGGQINIDCKKIWKFFLTTVALSATTDLPKTNTTILSKPRLRTHSYKDTIGHPSHTNTTHIRLLHYNYLQSLHTLHIPAYSLTNWHTYWMEHVTLWMKHITLYTEQITIWMEYVSNITQWLFNLHWFTPEPNSLS